MTGVHLGPSIVLESCYPLRFTGCNGRLGSGPDKLAELKGHPWFAETAWAEVLATADDGALRTSAVFALHAVAPPTFEWGCMICVGQQARSAGCRRGSRGRHPSPLIRE